MCFPEKLIMLNNKQERNPYIYYSSFEDWYEREQTREISTQMASLYQGTL